MIEPMNDQIPNSVSPISCSTTGVTTSPETIETA